MDPRGVPSDANALRQHATAVQAINPYDKAAWAAVVAAQESPGLSGPPEPPVASMSQGWTAHDAQAAAIEARLAAGLEALEKAKATAAVAQRQNQCYQRIFHDPAV
mmetsp:Transcript_56146/g.149630  ORF Transcript_56146/g.149630 Transcript_56146/m.149630 type:complete len:106 (-) Transcript_56146:81-398(-)